jgi:phosphomannomutase
MNKILSFISRSVFKQKRKKIKAVIDCCNGAGSIIAPSLLNQLGCEVVAFSTNQGEIFPRNAEPLPPNLKELCRQVRSTKADIGFALDPDGDRLSIVDEKGKPLGEERTLVLTSHFFLSTFGATPLVVNLSTSKAMDDVAKVFGVSLYRTSIGEINVVKKMIRVKSRIGGEGNGGVIVPEIHPGRDASVGIAVLVMLLCQEGRPLSVINTLYPRYTLVKDKVSIEGLKPQMVYKKLKKVFPSVVNENHQDGLKLIFSDSWLHVRPSGTEPILRMFAEAPNASSARSLISRTRKIIKKW